VDSIVAFSVAEVFAGGRPAWAVNDAVNAINPSA
jgi:hypothetical protein